MLFIYQIYKLQCTHQCSCYKVSHGCYVVQRSFGRVKFGEFCHYISTFGGIKFDEFVQPFYIWFNLITLYMKLRKTLLYWSMSTMSVVQTCACYKLSVVDYSFTYTRLNVYFVLRYLQLIVYSALFKHTSFQKGITKWGVVCAVF